MPYFSKIMSVLYHPCISPIGTLCPVVQLGSGFSEVLKTTANGDRCSGSNNNLQHSVPLMGSGNPVQSPGVCGTATLHLEPRLSQAVYS